MTVGKRNAALCALISLLIVTLMSVSLTQGRYSKELTSDSEYSGSLEYIVSEQVEINSVDEFFSAIENGYSNIKVSDDVDNPLIITGSVSDVNSDLTIDLNGHELQRNNREPMLNVTEGVRLTIIDTSEKQTGSFYNPVGSVLRISGGTLTVAAGLFESGPRDGENLAGGSSVYSSEYAYQDGGVWRNEAGAKINGTASVAYYEKNGGGYTERQENMPVIIPAVTNVGSAPPDGGTPQHSVNGNFYFDADASSIWISKDAYLYFTVADGSVSNSLIAADNGSADFYYTYTLYRSFDGAGVVYSAAESSGAEEIAEEIEVTVYGYNGVMSAAQSAATYAAIQMNSGNLYVRGGDYVSYFGNDSTYCVYATGGYMAVENGVGSFQAHGAGKCVSISYGSVSEDEYLRVASGDFYSQIGDTIAVSGGLMRVSGDVSFTKDTATAEFASSQDNGSAISMTGGELYVSSTSSAIGFNLTGNYMNGISVSGGTLSVTGSKQNPIKFDINGSYVRGISSEVSDGAEGSVTVSYTDFNVGQESGDDDSIYGIYSAGGTITATDCSFDMVGGYARGIYSAGGTVNCCGSTVIDVNGTYSAGILAYGGNISVDGEYNSTIVGMTDNLLSSAAISSEGGDISIAGDSATITTDGLGITARSGASINISTTTFTLTSNNGTAIYINGGNLTIDEETTADITSTINEDYGWVTPPDEEGNQAGGNANVNKYNGVYIQGGSLTANGTFNVTHTGVATKNQEVEHEEHSIFGYTWYDPDGRSAGDGLITSFEIKSFAVRVEGGDGTEVVIDQGNIKNTVGGGLYVSGGKVTMGKDSSADDIKISTTGKELHNNSLNKVVSGFIPTTMGGNWQYKLNRTGGPAIQVNGGEITVYNGTYTAEQGDGLRVNGGTANIYGGVFAGNDHGYKANDATRAGPAASYAFKMQGGTANIYGGAFGTQNGTSKHDGSGAFVMGTAADARGVANIYGGTFEVKGQAGFSVYQYADVTFNQRGGENGEGGDILVSGTAAGMTVESASGGSTIEIMSGTFRSTRAEDGDGSGIWYSNANATLTIKGGNFEGSQRSGLYFAVNPGNSVQISGGTFTTKSTTNNAISGVDITYGSILSDSPAARAEVTYGNNSNSTYASDANTYITYVIEEGAWYDRIYYYAHTVNVFHD
ncbi:MAG TPA: hypothetical protein H9686_00825 [Firmicutes bacterium]|nr:hypothetical protein [Bacillota bacterium]